LGWKLYRNPWVYIQEGERGLITGGLFVIEIWAAYILGGGAALILGGIIRIQQYSNWY